MRQFLLPRRHLRLESRLAGERDLEGEPSSHPILSRPTKPQPPMPEWAYERAYDAAHFHRGVIDPTLGGQQSCT